MTLKDLFQEFDAGGAGSQSPRTAPVPNVAEMPSDGGAGSYDAGYKSGWDDAVRASEERGERVSAELERTVQDLGFSYHEALDQLRGQFLEVLTQFLDALLPGTLPQVFRTQLEAILADEADQSPEVEIVLSPEQVALFETLLTDDSATSVSFVAEGTLGLDQAYIRIGQRETLIDVGPLIKAFKDQVLAFGDTTNEVRHAG